MHHTESACSDEHRGQRSAAGQSLWRQLLAVRVLLERTRARAKFQFTLWGVSQDWRMWVVSIRLQTQSEAVMNINIRASWAETEHACSAATAVPACRRCVWTATTWVHDTLTCAQYKASTVWPINTETHTMWPNWLEQRANNTHHSIVQQSKNHCH